MEKRDMVCIVCPMGCRLTLKEDATQPGGYEIIGNQCKRGIEYAIKETTNPTRTITTTVKIKNALLNRIPVRTDQSIAKNKIFECMRQLDLVEVTGPVKMGEVIVENILGTGVNIIASRSM
ncbi:DUF1667 domain-containing protein [Geosporobacter ferrireducens]|uniref:Molybdopterin oxidoreductase n=1 Tax=Geosporobacter ferrireducens TaxID=1424294 RepID=A0A1D8GHP6_9FIRM|nr:DUF1667 domain-containing protein [Geosporobacter ferrireducens]AOT70424.1 molybdopterin oxidoreductase [Geosporobacter ferrireducens]MTI58135.1 DUF1667 domain-containing protein [Geosporobacter ferrireducens]